METENRSIIILFSVVVLLIFLDHQSDRQLKLAGLEKLDRQEIIEKIRADKLTSSLEEETEKLDALHRPALDRKVRKSVERGVDAGIDRADDVSVTAREQAEETARTLEKGLKKTIDTARLKLKEVSLESEAPVSLPVLPSSFHDGQRKTDVSLFFPGFQGRKTVMMKVVREVPGTINPRQALTLLQKGPNPRERGLVNAFDQSMQLESVRMDGSQMDVHLGESVHRMSPPVRQDRIDQLCLTLFQFQEVRSIRLIVNGQVLQAVGKGKDVIMVPQPIRRIDRSVEDYKPI